MNAFQRKLRWLIVTGSTIGFLGGWGLLAHAGKPTTSTNTVSTTVQQQVAVAPVQLPPIDFNALESAKGAAPAVQPLPALPAITFSPRLTTGGS